MADPFYPTVDASFIEQQIGDHQNIIPNSKVRVGSTTSFVAKGTQAIFKRMVVIRELSPGEVSFEQASGLAIRFHFLGELLVWLEQHKAWKEGAYIVKQD